MLDLLIPGAAAPDGTGAAAAAADVGVKDGRIAARGGLCVGASMLVRDLPASGRRLRQESGKDHFGTWLGAQCVLPDGQLIDARPGTLVRAGR